MVVRVADQARKSGAQRVVIATDHAGVKEAAELHGHLALMTRSDHAQGTDRIAEVVAQLALADDAIVVNVQGDEPLIDPQLIAKVAETLAARPEAAIATAAHAITNAEEFFNPNVVKVVCNSAGLAHYFSRAPIPYARDAFLQSKTALPENFPALRHIGIYAYRASFLKRYSILAAAPTEQIEALEQLRAMFHGFAIAVHVWQGALAPSVDTPEDLQRVRRLFSNSR